MSKIIEMATLHITDAIYFPIVVDGRHGIARYTIIHDDDGLIVNNHTLLEFYYLNGVNAELGVFQYILDKLEKTPTMNHPDITALATTKLIPIDISKLAKKKIYLTVHLSYRARDGDLIAYCSVPFCMVVLNNIVGRITPRNIKCGDTLEDRFKFIANFVVNCYS